MCQGTSYVYDSFFRPYVAKHENEIDRNLLELRTRAGDMVVLYWQRAASYGQTRIFDILQYVASQSTPRRHNAQVVIELKSIVVCAAITSSFCVVYKKLSSVKPEIGCFLKVVFPGVRKWPLTIRH